MKHALSRLDLTIRPFGLEAPRVKRSKFNVDRSPEAIARRTIDGHVFHSDAEARRYMQLKLLERAGHIKQIELQPIYKIEIDGKLVCKVILDFRYWEGQLRIVEDVKGRDTAVSKLKRKLVEASYPGTKVMVVAA